MAFETYVAYETKYKSVSSVAIPITHADWGWVAGSVERATRIYITPYENDVVVLWSGVAPTSVVGHVIAKGATLELTGAQNIQNLQIIRKTADTVVTITLEA